MAAAAAADEFIMDHRHNAMRRRDVLHLVCHRHIYAFKFLIKPDNEYSNSGIFERQNSQVLIKYRTETCHLYIHLCMYACMCVGTLYSTTLPLSASNETYLKL